MKLLDQLLLVAFRFRVRDSDAEAGRARVEAILARSLAAEEFHDAVAQGLAQGWFHDPVRLLPGALQCHWQLELTPQGVEAARALPEPDAVPRG
ncbi:MAG TPA: hypothetical protein VGC80_10375 [Acetobacteraceae bacterium]